MAVSWSSSLSLLTLSLPLLLSLYVSMYSGGRRSSLPATLARRARLDEALLDRSNSHEEWYDVDLKRINDTLFRSKFLKAHMDEETYAFVEKSVDKSSWLMTQLWHNLAKSFLMHILRYSKTDANGWLRRGSMFVLSSEQLQRMLDSAEIDAKQLEKVVDLGAGDGEVGKMVYSHFGGSVFATEASSVMRELLLSKGITVLDIDTWSKQSFDVVMCFNLIDRCDKPLSLLQEMHQALNDHGLLLLAAVLPYKPYVEFSADHRPKERLKIPGKGFEEQAQSLSNLLNENGFQVLSWTRVPYLSEGDLVKSIYSLSNAVFLLKKRS